MKIRDLKDTEYKCIRAQIGQQDQACLTLVGILLASSTAVYGLAIEKGAYSLLPILSILWVVGFLYICEKRFAIRRSALYLREVVESKESGLYWQTWLKENENDGRFLRFSPLRLEYTLLLLVNITNVYLTGISLSDSNNKAYHASYAVISCLMLVLSLLIYFKIVRRYYHDARNA